MDKDSYYKFQAEAFVDYITKLSTTNIYSTFIDWTDSKDIAEQDIENIWRIARKIKPTQEKIIAEESEEFVRLSTVLDMMLQRDLAKLELVLHKEEAVDKT
jgi:hypothetical protein